MEHTIRMDMEDISKALGIDFSHVETVSFDEDEQILEFSMKLLSLARPEPKAKRKYNCKTSAVKEDAPKKSKGKYNYREIWSSLKKNDGDRKEVMKQLKVPYHAIAEAVKQNACLELDREIEE